MAKFGWGVGGFNADYSENESLVSNEEYLVAEVLTCNYRHLDASARTEQGRPA